MGVAREAAATHLHAEVVELALVEAALEEGAGVDAGGGVALEVDGVARHAVFLAAEEVVEADLVERGRGGEGREVTTDAVGDLVGPDDHGRRVPADEGPDATLDELVSGEEGLVLGRDRVDVVGPHVGVAELELTGVGVDAAEQVAGAGLALAAGDRVERLEPLGRLLGVDVGQLAQETIEGHASIQHGWRVGGVLTRQ